MMFTAAVSTFSCGMDAPRRWHPVPPNTLLPLLHRQLLRVGAALAPGAVACAMVVAAGKR